MADKSPRKPGGKNQARRSKKNEQPRSSSAGAGRARSRRRTRAVSDATCGLLVWRPTAPAQDGVVPILVSWSPDPQRTSRQRRSARLLRGPRPLASQDDPVAAPAANATRRAARPLQPGFRDDPNDHTPPGGHRHLRRHSTRSNRAGCPPTTSTAEARPPTAHVPPCPPTPS
jgi:hypothetical protein